VVRAGRALSDRPPKIHVHALDADLLGDGLDAAVPRRVWGSLSRRAPILAREHDLVIVDAPPDPAWLSLLGSLGIRGFEVLAPAEGPGSLCERILADSRLCARLRDHAGELCPYMGSAPMHALARALGLGIRASDPDLVALLNRKTSLASILERARAPALASLVSPRDEVIARSHKLFRDHNALIVRADLSIGGFGVWTITRGGAMDSLERGLERSDPDRLFLIEPRLDVVCSPNVQYDLRPGEEPERIGVSDQRFGDDLAFGGNTSPSELGEDPRLLEQGDAIVRTLGAMGYRGVVGIDFIATRSGELFAIEINPRINTSSFALELARRSGAPAFELATGIERSCAVEDDAGALGPGEWIVPLSPPSRERSVLDAAALAATRERCAQLVRSLRSRGAREDGGVCAHR